MSARETAERIVREQERDGFTPDETYALAKAYLEAADEVADWRNDMFRVMAEPCEDDNRRHCTCVPHLRRQLDRAQAVIDAATAVTDQHFDTCDLVKGTSAAYPCSCGIDALRLALAAAVPGAATERDMGAV